MPLEKVCGKIYIREVYKSGFIKENIDETIFMFALVKHKTLNEMLQELPDVGQFILAMDTWFEKLMEK